MDHLMIFVEIGTCIRPFLLAIGLGLALTPARATPGFDLDSLMPTVPSRGSSGIENYANRYQPQAHAWHPRLSAGPELEFRGQWQHRQQAAARCTRIRAPP